MSMLTPTDFSALYTRFESPIAEVNCGQKCAPYNQNGIPFCCDTRHALPSAYKAEWEYLQAKSDLWEGDQSSTAMQMQRQTPPNQVLIACLGYTYCQRSFRTITCRAFPFFPYINRQGEFIGLTYYWQYEDRCWLISNLDIVSTEYQAEFIVAYDALFEGNEEEFNNFRYHSMIMRRIFRRRQRAITLLPREKYRQKCAYKITPSNGRLRRVPIENLPKFGPYKIAAKMPFPDEL